MNIPDLDGEDGQLVVRCNCRNFHNANQLILICQQDFDNQ